MSAHTPGPWTAERDNDMGECSIGVVGPDGNWLCTLGIFPYFGARTANDALRGRCGASCHSAEELVALADARLMARAPSLLSALRGLVDASLRMRGAERPRTATPTERDFDAALDAAAAALAEVMP